MDDPKDDVSTKDQLLSLLEGRFVRMPFEGNEYGRKITREYWRKISNGTVEGQCGIVKLENFTADQLVTLLSESTNPVDYERWFNDQQRELQRVMGN